MQICKKWPYQLGNFLTNISKNIIWHLFASESHQVVKITVTYCILVPTYIVLPAQGWVSPFCVK
jgi:hypothetical protein